MALCRWRRLWVVRWAVRCRRHVLCKCGHRLHAGRRRYEGHGLRKSLGVHLWLRLFSLLRLVYGR